MKNSTLRFCAVLIVILYSSALTLLSQTKVSALSESDIAGKWKSEYPGPNGPAITIYTFKVENGELTGTVSGRQSDTEFSEGKINGNEISFVVVRKLGEEERRIQYKGKISGDELKISIKFGDSPARESIAKRVRE